MSALAPAPAGAPPTAVWAAERPRRSLFEQPAYLAASAEHTRSTLVAVRAAGASLPLLRSGDGALRTVYGLPRPAGAADPQALDALSDALVVLAGEHPLTAVLSPLAPGPALAERLLAAGGRTIGARPICVAALDPAVDPAERFSPRARRAIRITQRRATQVETGPLTEWFGTFYRAAMIELGSEAIYLFSDTYFQTLRTLPHLQVTVSDSSGPAAAVLFMLWGGEAYYHLGGRRAGDSALRGGMSLGLAEGVREAWRLGCRLAVLGGGRSDALDDSLLQFKRQLADDVLPRAEVALGPELLP